jgi:hypothetical protein
MIQWVREHNKKNKDDNICKLEEVAYCGKYGFPFYLTRVSMWKAGWIEERKHDDNIIFAVHCNFPSTIKICYPNLDDAKKFLEWEFKWFIKMCK